MNLVISPASATFPYVTTTLFAGWVGAEVVWPMCTLSFSTTGYADYTLTTRTLFRGWGVFVANV